MRRPIALAAFATAALAAVAASLGRGAPAQPVAFSHALHAGTLTIGCTSCHATALRSPVAGIPSAQRCYGCHKFVGRDKPEVQKVVDAYESGKPIEWARVNRVPDHVFFAHDRHLAAGVRCQECHGDVASMTTAVLVRPGDYGCASTCHDQMGWCLDCHQKRGAPRECTTCHK